MSFVCFHAYHVTPDLASDEHPEAVKVRQLLDADAAANTRYQKLGQIDRTLLGAACLVFGGSPLSPSADGKYVEEWSLASYLTRASTKLPALGLSDYLQRSAASTGGQLRLLSPIEVLHVSLQPLPEYFDVVAASCAPTYCFPYAWRRRAEFLHITTSQLDLLFSNLSAARNKEKDTADAMSQLYAKLSAREASIEEEMDLLCFVGCLLGIF